MKPVKQLIFKTDNNGVGDCLRACVASILEFSIEDVPNFIEWEQGNGEYLTVLNDFLGAYGYKALNVWFADWDDPTNWKPPGYHMIYGYSERGIKHAVVGFQGEMVFDPHPDGTGLTTVDSYTVLVASLADPQYNHPEGDLATGETSVRSSVL